MSPPTAEPRAPFVPAVPELTLATGGRGPLPRAPAAPPAVGRPALCRHGCPLRPGGRWGGHPHPWLPWEAQVSVAICPAGCPGARPGGCVWGWEDTDPPGSAPHPGACARTPGFLPVRENLGPERQGHGPRAASQAHCLGEKTRQDEAGVRALLLGLLLPRGCVSHWCLGGEWEREGETTQDGLPGRACCPGTWPWPASNPGGSTGSEAAPCPAAEAGETSSCWTGQHPLLRLPREPGGGVGWGELCALSAGESRAREPDAGHCAH